MILNILCDAHWESGLERVSKDLSSTGYRNAFEERDYGQGLVGVVVILMCRDPSLHFKRRIRFKKSEKMLYIDIMLNLDQMRQVEHMERKKIVVQRLADEVPAILRRYSIPDFDEVCFVEDLRNWLKGIV
jgi:hypothetical protein